MSLLAEEIVEEWLNRQGFFTIRGARVGLYEMDLLATRTEGDRIECRHLEVTASTNPISYITDLPKQVQRQTGRKPKNAKKRSMDILRRGVQEWIEKKYLLQAKMELKQALIDREWSHELVVHKVRHPEELELLQEAGIRVTLLSQVVRELQETQFPIKRASGASLVELVLLETD